MKKFGPQMHDFKIISISLIQTSSSKAIHQKKLSEKPKLCRCTRAFSMNIDMLKRLDSGTMTFSKLLCFEGFLRIKYTSEETLSRSCNG